MAIKFTRGKEWITAHRSGIGKWMNLLFGIALPIACLVFDPIIFKSTEFGRPSFPEYRFMAILFISIEILFFSCWSIFSAKLQALRCLFGGVFIAGAVFSILLGVLILPISVIGVLFFGLGFLGLIPFFTGLIYLNRAINCFGAFGVKKRWVDLSSAMTGLLIMIVLLVAAQEFVSTLVSRVRFNGVRRDPIAVKLLKPVANWVDITPLLSDYPQASPERKKELAETYQALTGRNIEEVLDELD